jgi:hypothetical protein
MGPLRSSEGISYAPVTFTAPPAAKTFLVYINGAPQATADSNEIGYSFD